MKCDVFPYRLPFAQPVRGQTHRTGWWVRLTASDGLTGWGEAACWPGFGSDEATVKAALRGSGTAPEVDCAFDVARLDLMARRRELPIARLLHPAAVKRVPTHVLVRSAADARAAEQAGATALKVKVDAADLARVAAIREATALPLRLDCNGLFGSDIAPLRRFTPEWIEQPTAPGEPLPAGPIAVDEAITGPNAVERALEAGAKVIVLKPMFLGGLRATQRLARQVWSAGARVCVTHALGSAIDRIATRHLAAALLAENPETACGLAGQLRDDVAALPPLRNGYLGVPQGPGLGIEVWS
jgi:L-alanine-DL-glutamate epimerase-like enolase superfamily enzyme